MQGVKQQGKGQTVQMSVLCSGAAPEGTGSQASKKQQVMG